MASPTITQTDFTPSQTLATTGIDGPNAQHLINSVGSKYPEQLVAAQQTPENIELTKALTPKDLAAASKLTGFGRKGLALKVRGGEFDVDEAIVTYSALTDNGVLKGCFPYSALASGSDDDHVSQRDALNDSAAAAEFASTAEAEADEPQAAAAAPAPKEPEPVKGYDAMSREKIIAALGTASRATAYAVDGYESRQGGRKTIVDAAQKRVAELDDADAKAVEENEALKKRVAELEAAAGSTQGSDDTPPPAPPAG